MRWCGVFLLAAAARGDILVEADPGQREVEENVHLDAGPLRGHLVREYEIRKGDTLSEIARDHLGDTRRWQEIEALNPQLLPERLLPGQRIWLPGELPGPCSALFVVTGWNTLQLWREGEPLPCGQVYAVPGERIADFRALVEARQSNAPAPIPYPRVRTAMWIGSVPGDDPLRSVTSWWRISELKGDEIAVELLRQERRGAEAARGRSPWTNPLLFGVALLGLAGMLRLLRRRGRAGLSP